MNFPQRSMVLGNCPASRKIEGADSPDKTGLAAISSIPSLNCQHVPLL
jgi:hypothetical protein